VRERLQKIISQAGIASRRHAEELIAGGQVTVNGVVITELGTKADPQTDHIKVRGKLINNVLARRAKVHVLLNKPKGYLSSVSDPDGRPLVTELIPPSLGKLYPVGRLDFNTEGLLLLTNDGEFTNFITAARNQIVKIYEAKVKGTPSEAAVNRLRSGVTLDDGQRTTPAEIKLLKSTGENAWYEIYLHQGRNQQIRKMFDLIGYSVVKLRRVQLGFLNDRGLRIGAWRLLSEAEVKQLMKARTQRTTRQSRLG
jgi:23S rRNA pseudouridine2605 synthase